MACPACGRESLREPHRCACGYCFDTQGFECEYVLRPGMMVDEVLALFDEESKGGQYYARMRDLLSDPITSDQTRVLQEWADSMESLAGDLGDLVRWLEWQPGSLSEFIRHSEQQRRLTPWEQAGGYRPWPELERLRRADPRQGERWPSWFPVPERADACPQCGTPARELAWVPIPGGWLWRRRPSAYVTVCDRCRIQVAFIRKPAW